jgi:hypothetical protein
LARHRRGWLHALIWLPLTFGLSVGFLRVLIALLLNQLYVHRFDRAGGMMLKLRRCSGPLVCCRSSCSRCRSASGRWSGAPGSATSSIASRPTRRAAAPLDELLKGDPLRLEYGRVTSPAAFLHDKEFFLAARSLKTRSACRS